MEDPRRLVDEGCSIYLAIHSNAGDMGKAKGAVALFHPASKDSKALGKILVEELNGHLPLMEIDWSEPLCRWHEGFSGKGFGEIRTPYEYGITPVLLWRRISITIWTLSIK